VTALATAVGVAFAGRVSKLVAILLAAFFLFITVVYNFSFARLVFVSGLDQKLPAAMAKVNKHKVPSNAVLVQTVIASLFALVAFIVFPSLGVGGGQPIDIQTKVYDVLQAAVTVIWCLSMVVLFVDVVIIIRRTTTTTTPTTTSSTTTTTSSPTSSSSEVTTIPTSPVVPIEPVEPVQPIEPVAPPVLQAPVHTPAPAYTPPSAPAYTPPAVAPEPAPAPAPVIEKPAPAPVIEAPAPKVPEAPVTTVPVSP